jgi:hypothetical protein
MTFIGRILVDEAHRQAWTTRPELAAVMNPQNPADASYADIAETARSAGFLVTSLSDGLFDAQVLAGADVVVIPHAADDDWESTTKVGSPKLTDAEMDALVLFVERGGGLLITAETEAPKYANTHSELAARFGIIVNNATVQDPTHAHKDVPTWILAQKSAQSGVDLLSGVESVCMYRAGTLSAANDSGAFAFLQTSADASHPNAPLAMGRQFGAGRVVVLADSDFLGDDSVAELSHRALWLNLVTWLAPRNVLSESAASSTVTQTPAWRSLVEAIETLRPLQNKDGSIKDEHRADAAVSTAAQTMLVSIAEIAPHFPHQAAHLEMTLTDLQRWIDSDFGVPDFFDSLMLFHPDQMRQDGLHNFVVFPMYTQNGNLNRNFEAVITSTFWPDWLAELERTKYQNPAFVPIEFVGFTKGYDTHSAVLFPETVATREVGTFTWGGIFCDRESARFRRIATEASSLLKMSLPPEAELLLNRQSLAQETFVLWDLIHDRAHSHGDLPFDPFMIKQRMPYWLYALEELRCDLNTYRETLDLDDTVYRARYVRIAILFDRLFRFPITGGRERNYDGLGGQLIFAWLHKHDVLRWTDNTLSLDWSRIDDVVVALCEAVDNLYRDGIDRSKLAHWLATHEFVASWVQPHPGSVWAKGVEALAITGETKELVDAVLPDEFPLNVFYEALRSKLASTIAGVSGITGSQGVQRD